MFDIFQENSGKFCIKKKISLFSRISKVKKNILINLISKITSFIFKQFKYEMQDKKCWFKYSSMKNKKNFKLFFLGFVNKVCVKYCYLY